eukprot:207154-Rhodomonas_salina.2
MERRQQGTSGSTTRARPHRKGAAAPCKAGPSPPSLRTPSRSPESPSPAHAAALPRSAPDFCNNARADDGS